ncbi:F-box domain-containing protein [Favolaschia claudopus]|uniref:F-box domain-containing protein n=1 Tax=Favolaschia claudopus TaxID=2862362 RepID=A0AAW0EE30_9AGAR
MLRESSSKSQGPHAVPSRYITPKNFNDLKFHPHVNPMTRSPDLPFELLEKIFILSIEPAIDRQGRPFSKCLGTVFVLCHVCAFWRFVALHTRQLWNLGGTPIFLPSRWIRSHAATKMFLERSADLPVSFHLCQYPVTRKHHSYRIRNLEGILDTINQISERWETFHVTLEEAEHEVNALEKIPAERLDNLKKLVLTLRNRGGRWGRDASLKVFSSAPQLQDVSINMMSTSGSLSHFISLPWRQLTQLSVGHDHPSSVLHAVLACTSLVSASITTRQWTQMFPTMLPAVPKELPHLERLDILVHLHHEAGADEGEHLGPFLHCIMAPALKFLALELGFSEIKDEDESWLGPVDFVMPLAIFLSRALQLEHLRTTDCITSDMVGVLFFTPALKWLEYSDAGVDDEFFAGLEIRGDGSPVLAPHLEQLDLNNVGDEYEEARVQAMIASRWWADDAQHNSLPVTSRLKRVRLWNEDIPPKLFSPEFELKMKQYRSEGLDVRGFYF